MVLYIGYAAMFDNMNTLPQVRRGFEIYSVTPATGSLHGGSKLSFSGFGFLADAVLRHSLTLSDQIGSTSYNQLVSILGITTAPNVTSHIFNCNITRVTFSQIECTTPYEKRPPLPGDQV